MSHPNQAQPRRTQVSRAPRKPGPSRQSSLSFATRRRRPLGKIRFAPDPSRLGKVLPPHARQRKAARRPERLDVLGRCTNYAQQAMRTGVVKTALTPTQRRRVASKGKLSPDDRAAL